MDRGQEMESDVVVYRRMSAQRVIDSSSNRLAEALRVMEDVVGTRWIGRTWSRL